VNKVLTPAYVGRHLGATATDTDEYQMVGTIAAEKAKVFQLLEVGIEDYVGWVAKITGATYPCKYGGSEPIDCYGRKNLVDSWKLDGGELNTKRMAFIWYFAGKEIYETANLGSHEEWLEKHVMEKLKVEYNPPPGPREQKSCIRALYSHMFNNHRYNLFRNNGGNHETQVQITHPKDIDLGLPRTYRREKTVFFVHTRDCQEGTNGSSEWKVVSIHLDLWGEQRQCHSIQI
jgi:hypothetical protein